MDEKNDLYHNLNKEMISIEKVEDKFEIQELQDLIQEHVEATGSERGKQVLDSFAEYLPEI